MNSKTCTCNKCECDLNTTHEKEKEILRVHEFLVGLDDSVHGVIRSQICSISPLPYLDSVYQTILQNETLRLNTTPEVPVMIFATQAPSTRKPGSVYTRDILRHSSNDSSGSRGGQGNQDWLKQCSACGRAGHEASACFKVIGYPEWWGDRPKYRIDNRASQATPPNKHGRGHNPRANVTQFNTAAVGSSNELNEHDRQGLSGLTDDQWATIQKLINTGKSATNLSGKSHDTPWILDT